MTARGGNSFLFGGLSAHRTGIQRIPLLRAGRRRDCPGIPLMTARMNDFILQHRAVCIQHAAAGYAMRMLCDAVRSAGGFFARNCFFVRHMRSGRRNYGIDNLTRTLFRPARDLLLILAAVNHIPVFSACSGNRTALCIRNGVITADVTIVIPLTALFSESREDSHLRR